MSRLAPVGARGRALAGAGALAIDALPGEPPARFHPVAGVGRMPSAVRRCSRAENLCDSVVALELVGG